MRELWNSSKKDFCTWAGCLLVCLCAGVEMGLLFGTVLKMIFLVLGLANPKLEVIRDNVRRPRIEKINIERIKRNPFLTLCSAMEWNSFWFDQ